MGNANTLMRNGDNDDHFRGDDYVENAAEAIERFANGELSNVASVSPDITAAAWEVGPHRRRQVGFHTGRLTVRHATPPVIRHHPRSEHE